MYATQILAHASVAEKIRKVLSACQYNLSSADYARCLVETLAGVTQSEYAVWLNWPAGPGPLVAETEGFASRRRVYSLCECVPRLFNDVDPSEGVHSIVAAPVMFRSCITGVLAVANSALPYTPADLDLLRDIGRAAVLEHETLLRAEALGLAGPRQRAVDLVHGLRQPLGILEACAFYLDLILPPGEERAREQLAAMQSQLERASGILDESVQVYPSCKAGRDLDEAEPADDESRVFTKSAMSMVT